jgi:anti-sigma B factor antagonist
VNIPPFEIGVSLDALRVSGEIDMAVAPQLLDAILCFATTSDRSTVAVDIRDVTFMDSRGIAALVEANKRLDGIGCRLILENPQPTVARVIDVTGVGECLKIRITIAD